MTSEIIVLNKNGIALAADSAATFKTSKGNDKIFNTANKVFGLSKVAPVAIMIYNNSEYLGVPWETIIKCYRKKLGEKTFPTLEEYVKDFFDYVKNEIKGISRLDRSSDKIFDRYHGLMKDFLKTIKDEYTKNNPQHTDEEFEMYFVQQLADEREICGNDVPEVVIQHVLEKDIEGLSTYVSEFEEILKRDYKVADSASKGLSANMVNLVVLNVLSDYGAQSGIVITGYGEDEIFPSYFEHKIFDPYKGKDFFIKLHAQAIDDKTRYGLKGFAQAEEINTFVNGIQGLLMQTLESAMDGSILGVLPEEVLKHLNKTINKQDERAYNALFQGAIEKVREMFFNNVNKFYQGPIKEALPHFSLPELSDMAETLVNQERFRKKVTTQTPSETVGGPIDVAVISKGDGLVWIKRKLYFDKEINHNYFRNYNKL